MTFTICMPQESLWQTLTRFKQVMAALLPAAAIVFSLGKSRLTKQSRAAFTAILRDKVTNFVPSADTKNVEICLFKSCIDIA